MPPQGSGLTRCPMCDGQVTVKDSRINALGWRHRRRQCLECKHTWITYELPAEYIDNLRSFVLAVQVAKTQVGRLEHLAKGFALLDKDVFDQ